MSLISHDIYLASASPRRAELLQQIGVRFQCCSVDIDERQLPGESAKEYVCRLATEKAFAGQGLVAERQVPVLGADTIVVVDGAVLGKPLDAEQAQQMLARLSNNWHEVLTAVTVIGEGVHSAEAQVERSCSVTRVHMRKLSTDEIAAYGRRERVSDKAGAYAVQGIAASFIDRIEGSYSGVMGLPLYETNELLKRFGIDVLIRD
ncbi:MAG: septum formation protein Maf [Gammaproteobacteria bacterium]|nr:septum formation inhibitor Maf [Gammaproteobacteria bacterium]PCH62899.1 MAG: septum formation protein Maf [Gammaproteobacteria bacterium]PCH64643.1 MAG: septum formation protein Maf [Gammaproteobacteria bacterium]